MSLKSDTAKTQLTMSGFLGLMGTAFLLIQLYLAVRGGRELNLVLLFATTTLLIAYPVIVGLSLKKSGRSVIYVRRGLAVGIVLSAVCLAVAAVPWAQATAARDVSNLVTLAVWALAGTWIALTVLVEGIDLSKRHPA